MHHIPKSFQRASDGDQPNVWQLDMATYDISFNRANKKTI
ncbi:hypothetical protein pah_c186o009 [Parachlamydia acanthamoebae str. Hall's coccus]|nr:hypothetical protein pah_c186o009 [Parachlamydia acanthamoebae str. Hall's coccus]